MENVKNKDDKRKVETICGKNKQVHLLKELFTITNFKMQTT